MAHEYSPSAADLDKVTRANGSGRQPVVFVHGLWLLDIFRINFVRFISLHDLAERECWRSMPLN